MTKKAYPKWSNERRRKFMKTMRMKKMFKKKYFKPGMEPLDEISEKGQDSRDAVVILRQATSYVVRALKNGSLKAPDQAHLYAMIALNLLEGRA
jgi:hypothetical protein